MKTQTVYFRFTLGDWTYLKLRRSLAVQQIALSDRVEPDAALQLPGPVAPAGADGVLVRGVPVHAAPAPVEASHGCLRYVVQAYRHCYIDLRQDFDTYQAKFSGKTRSTLRRKVRKFAEACGGEPRMERFDGPDRLDRFFDLARRISARTYQERLLDAGLPDDPPFRARAKALAAAGQLRAFLLFHGERPVSYLYCPARDGVLEYAFLGYDPDYTALSAGTVLQWLALQGLFAEQLFTHFDFTEGESDHKRLFATHERLEANVCFLPVTAPNRLLVHSHLAADRAARRIGDTLERLGLKARVRRLIRFGLRPSTGTAS